MKQKIKNFIKEYNIFTWITALIASYLCYVIFSFIIAITSGTTEIIFIGLKGIIIFVGILSAGMIPIKIIELFIKLFYLIKQLWRKYV